VTGISLRHGDAGDTVASPTLKNWPLFGQKISKFGQSIQLHSRVSEVLLTNINFNVETWMLFAPPPITIPGYAPVLNPIQVF